MIPKSWSLSKLGTFTKCRRKFLYSYIEGRPAPAGSAADRGVAVHAAIEAFFKDGKSLPPEFAYWTNYFTTLRSLPNFPELELGMRPGWVPCSFGDPTVWWRGVLDLWVLHEGKGWLFDWKTGKIYEDHDDQKELYAIASFLAHPEIDEIQAFHIYVDIKKTTHKVYQRDSLDALIAKWNAKLAPYFAALAMVAADPTDAHMYFSTNPGYLCAYCPYSKNPCPH